jgi:hypothetical protein
VLKAEGRDGNGWWVRFWCGRLRQGKLRCEKGDKGEMKFHDGFDTIHGTSLS